jgi:riboflavin biosynthesis pyrimidine reductase
VRLALDHLRRLGARRITVEAGPTSARELYDAPARVDELWLATFAGAAPPGEAVGPAFVEDARLAAVLPEASAPSERSEADGPWRFERRRRAQAAA